jgi:hypothetical protein
MHAERLVRTGGRTRFIPRVAQRAQVVRDGVQQQPLAAGALAWARNVDVTGFGAVRGAQFHGIANTRVRLIIPDLTPRLLASPTGL